MDEQIIPDEDFDIVDEVYSAIIETKEPADLEGAERLVFLVENYNQEINSGLDFIQWLRWAEPFQLKETPDALAEIGLIDSYEICQQALEIAFEGELPREADEKEAMLDVLEEDEDKEEIREQLEELAQNQEEQNYNLTTGLAAWIRANIK